MRIPNDELELLDVMVEAGGFRSRSECLRAFVKPIFEVAKDAMIKKGIGFSTVKISLKEYGELTKHLKRMGEKSKVSKQFILGGEPPEISVEALA